MPALSSRFLQACCFAASPASSGPDHGHATPYDAPKSTRWATAAPTGPSCLKPRAGHPAQLYLDPTGAASFGSLPSDDSGGAQGLVAAGTHSRKMDIGGTTGSSSTDTGPTSSTLASTGSMGPSAAQSSATSLSKLRSSSATRGSFVPAASNPLPLPPSAPSLSQELLPSSLSLNQEFTQGLQPRARPPSLQQLADANLNPHTSSHAAPASGDASIFAAASSTTTGASELQRCSSLAVSQAASSPFQLKEQQASPAAAGSLLQQPTTPSQITPPPSHTPLPRRPTGRRDTSSTAPTLPAMLEEAPAAVVPRVRDTGAVGALRRAFTLGRTTPIGGRTSDRESSNALSLSNHTPSSSLITTADSVFDAALRVAAAQAALQAAGAGAAPGPGNVNGPRDTNGPAARSAATPPRALQAPPRLMRSVQSDPMPGGSSGGSSGSSGQLAASRSSQLLLSSGRLASMDGGSGRWGGSGGLLGASVQRLEGRAAEGQGRMDAAAATATNPDTATAKPTGRLATLMRSLSSKGGAAVAAGAAGGCAIPREDEAAARAFADHFLQALKECNPKWGSDPGIGVLLDDGAVMVALDKQHYSGRTAIIRRLNQGMEQFLKMVGLDVPAEETNGPDGGDEGATSRTAARQAQMASKAGRVEASLEVTALPARKQGQQHTGARGSSAGAKTDAPGVGQPPTSVVVVTYTFKAGMRRFQLQDRFKVRSGRIIRLRRLRL